MDSIYIFGASIRGQQAYKNLRKKYNVIGFIDNDSKKQGSKIHGLPIYSPEESAKKPSRLIVIASQYEEEIAHQLIDMGIAVFGFYYHNNKTEPCIAITDTNKNNIDNKTQILLIQRNFSGSNTYALNEYCKSKAIDGVKLISKSGNISEYYSYIFSTIPRVQTHDSIVRDDTVAFQLWHGVPLKGLNRMSRYQTNKHREDFEKYWQKYKKISSYSQTYSTLMNACFGGNIEQYCITGAARNDLLFNSNGKDSLERILDKKIDKKLIIGYFPTFKMTSAGQKNGDLRINLFNFADYDAISLKKWLKDNESSLIVKLHPDDKVHNCLYEDEDSNEIIFIHDQQLAEKETDLYETLNAFDVIITDYSSIYFDYLLLDRPLIFVPTDIDTYRSERGHLIEPYEFWAPGPKCTSQSDFMNTIKNITIEGDHWRTSRQIIRSIVHTHTDNNACERTLQMISDDMHDNLI